MKRSVLSMIAAVLVFSMSLTACQSQKNAVSENSNGTKTSKGSVAFITSIGGLGDKNLNDLTFAGAQLHKQQGVKVDVVEPREASDYPNLQKLFAEKKSYSSIVAIGFDQGDALTQTADSYPDQQFIIADTVVDKPNVTSVVFRPEETGFQLGVLAGKIMKDGKLPNSRNKNTIGFVGGMDIPIINQFAAGFVAGAKLVNPTVKVKLSYVGSFSDPGKATELANGLYDDGADIIFACAGGSGLGVIKSAETNNGYALGVESNQNVISPDHVIASGTRDWDKAIYNHIQKGLNKELNGGVASYGIKENAVHVERSGSNVQVDQSVLDLVAQLSNAVADGKIKLPLKLDAVDLFLSNNKL